MKSQGRLLLFVIIVADLLIIMAIIGLRLINARHPGVEAIQTTGTPQTSPGLVVYGVVNGPDGVGLADVAIYRSYSSYPGVEIAITDATGHYQSEFYPIPGDEMVSVWAQQPGTQFRPAMCDWRHYAGYEMKSCNFSVSAGTQPAYLPLLFKTPK
jgi:hypothetical protein